LPCQQRCLATHLLTYLEKTWVYTAGDIFLPHTFTHLGHAPARFTLPRAAWLCLWRCDRRHLLYLLRPQTYVRNALPCHPITPTPFHRLLLYTTLFAATHLHSRAAAPCPPAFYSTFLRTSTSVFRWQTLRAAHHHALHCAMHAGRFLTPLPPLPTHRRCTAARCTPYKQNTSITLLPISLPRSAYYFHYTRTEHHTATYRPSVPLPTHLPTLPPPLTLLHTLLGTKKTELSFSLYHVRANRHAARRLPT